MSATLLRSDSFTPVLADLDINFALAGCPYSFATTPDGLKRAKHLLDELGDIELRHDEVEARFSQESKEVQDRIRRFTGAQFVFESNQLELTGLPLADTEKIIASAPKEIEKLASYLAEEAVNADRHLTEVLGLHRASLFIRHLASEYQNSQPITEVDIRSLHAATVPSERFAGEYRRIEVQIAGSDHEPPSVLDVPRQMAELVRWLNSTQAPPLLAATVVHSWLTIIHPFQDGNGRVARLLANLVLLRSGWPTLIVRSTDRLQYLDALSASDEAGDLLPLFTLFVKSVKRSLRELSKPGLAERLYEADLERDPDQRYKLWCGEITRFVERLRNDLSPDGWHVNRLSAPSPSTFLLLCEGDAGGNTWLAKVRHRDGRDLLLWLGYMSREMRDNSNLDRQVPSIFISVRDRSQNALHPYRNSIRDGSPISIDEVSLVPTAASHPILIRRAQTLVDSHSLEDAVAELTKAIRESTEA